MISYLDASALVKLVADEPESSALATEIERWPRQASSELARVEVGRAVRLGAEHLLPEAHQLLVSLNLLRLTRSIQSAAAELDPRTMRSLDAIHVATAQSLGAELGVLITYDRRMLVAAESAGVHAVAPR